VLDLRDVYQERNPVIKRELPVVFFHINANLCQKPMIWSAIAVQNAAQYSLQTEYLIHQYKQEVQCQKS
jgi:hypothetical protein